MQNNSKKIYKEDERQHLCFIEDIITRMNTNSFQIKTFTITIFSALIALYVNDVNKNKLIILVALIPTIIFWFLDAFYLQVERKYRKLYQDVVNKNVALYSLDVSKYVDCKTCYLKVLLSTTILPIYLSLVGIVLIIWVRF